MDQTSLSLLGRLRECRDDDTWRQLNDVYTLLLRRWLTKYHIQEADVDDLIQDVLIVVAEEVHTFKHNGQTGAFRSWLRSILVNRLRAFWRTRDRGPRGAPDSILEQQLAELADSQSEQSQLWDQEHDRHVLAKLLAISKSRFEATTWNAFDQTALQGQKADAVAKELGISLNAVFIAKSRVLSTLRQEAAGLVDASSNFLLRT